MTPGKVNLVIYQGATFSKEFVWQLGGVPVDLGDSSAVMDIRATIDDATPIITLSSTTGEIILVPAEGKVTLLLTSAETTELNFTRGVYDLEIHNTDGTVTRLVQGSVSLSKEVTR